MPCNLDTDFRPFYKKSPSTRFGESDSEQKSNNSTWTGTHKPYIKNSPPQTTTTEVNMKDVAVFLLCVLFCFVLLLLRRVIKKRTFYSQAYHKRWPSPFTVSFLWNFILLYFWPHIMIICVLKRILHTFKKKKSIFMQLLDSPLTYCCSSISGWIFLK